MLVQILDVDYIVHGNGHDGPIVTIYGTNEAGRSGVCRVAGFYPYFYIKTRNINDLVRSLPAGFAKVHTVKRYLPIGYQTEMVDVVKITLNNPRHVRDLRTEIMTMPGVEGIYEADIPFKNRFMIDNSLYGMGWIEVPDDAFDRIIKLSELRGIDKDDHAPTRIMSIDIECYTDGIRIPNADEFPIIMISLAFSEPYEGSDTLVLVAREIRATRESPTIFYHDEAAMLSGLVNVIRKYDPDIIVGYNSNEFDFPYIVQRARKHGIPLTIGRDGREIMISTTPSGANRIRVVGRVIIDMMNLIKANISLRQYNLNTVAHELLGMEKLDVKPSKIPIIWNNADTDISALDRLISYARQDAWLTLKLVFESTLLSKYTELSRLTGVLLQDIISGGQSGMIENVLLREYLKDQRLMPSRLEISSDEEEDSDPDYHGATVINPTVGLIDDIVVLDFKSLYPTIMIAHNICYTTYVDNTVNIDDRYVNKTVIGTRFVRPEVKLGVVPRILSRILDKRIQLKKLMKTASSDNVANYDAKQYALKILLNSFYGYSGYKRARLYCVDIASTVTGIGRYNLERTVSRINSMSSADGSIKFKVVYGDTDSVFVQLIPSDGKTVITYDLATRIGNEIAQAITRDLPAPMELVFESYVKRGLFVTKKRYALLIKNADGSERIKMKGLETVRRDWCPLTTKVLSKCIEFLLKEGDVEKAVNYVVETVRRLRSYESMGDDARRELINDLILTRKYTKPIDLYKNKQPHTELLTRLKSRGQSVPNIGDRVPFVIVAKHGGFTDRSEDPEYVLSNRNVLIDVDYYIDRQILPPVQRILEPFGVSRNQLLGKYMRILRTQNSKQRSIFDF